MTPLLEALRENWKRLKEGEAGCRFRDFREYRRGRSKSPVLTVGGGIVLVVGGLAIGWLPGPGGFIGVLGVALLATEWYFLAKLLDHLEIWLRQVRRIAWGERSAPVRVVVILVALSAAAGAAYTAGLILID